MTFDDWWKNLEEDWMTGSRQALARAAYAAGMEQENKELRLALEQLRTALLAGSELWGPDLGQYIANYGPHTYLKDVFAVLD